MKKTISERAPRCALCGRLLTTMGKQWACLKCEVRYNVLRGKVGRPLPGLPEEAGGEATDQNALWQAFIQYLHSDAGGNWTDEMIETLTTKEKQGLFDRWRSDLGGGSPAD